VIKMQRKGKYFPITTFRLPDCPYKIDTLFFIVSVSRTHRDPRTGWARPSV
jgi:hypothetical protein